MELIQSPAPLSPKLSVFLAGGITECSNWQADIVKLLEPYDIVLYNPRRERFDTNNNSVAANQISWEYLALRRSDMILFWFPHETLCPITLFELGNCLNSGKKLIVGVDYFYQRKFDVHIQCGLRGQYVMNGFDGFKSTVDEWVRMMVGNNG